MYGTTQRQRRKADAILIRRRGQRDDESVIFICGIAYAELRCSGIAPRRGSVTVLRINLA